jgi:hypothetical protein
MASIISAGTTSGTALNMAGDTYGQLQFQTNGTTAAVTIDTSQNVGIGTASPTVKLEVSAPADSVMFNVRENTSGNNRRIRFSNAGTVNTIESTAASGSTQLAFTVDGTERMRIDSSGNVLVGTTSNPNVGKIGVAFTAGTQSAWVSIPSTNTSVTTMQFLNSSGGAVGAITQTASATSYVTSSDYRLKENIVPMTGALDIVQALKPVTYNWKIDGSNGQGFIAHELQAIVPDAVVGEKDAVETYIDEDGIEQTRPKYQGVDTSFLVATLTAAIQEQQTIINDLKARITALEGAA